MSIELKIKSKHLSEEAKIIRFEERKLAKKIAYKKKKRLEAGNNTNFPIHLDADATKKYSLFIHRKWHVRNENRATYLARAFIAGRPYNTVEQKRTDEYRFITYIVPRICSMVLKYGIISADDYEYDKSKSKRVPSKALKEKILLWSKLE